MKMITFVLMGDNKPVSWQLPLTEVLIERIRKDKHGKMISEGLKKIKWVPGVDSYFAEDISKDLKPRYIWFTKGQLTIPANDKVQLALLKAHPWFNKYYKVYDESEESKEQLEKLRVSADAIRLIDDADQDKIRAIALGLFGAEAYNWDDATAELKLRKFAEKSPKTLQRELNSKDYESKYLAALAFGKGVVRENVSKNAVLWNDQGEGIIIRLAKGETGIHKLGEYLGEATEESYLVIQEISSRVKKMEVGEEPKEILAEKEDEIAMLKRKLAEAEAKNKEDKPVEKEKPEIESDLSLEGAVDAYEKKHKKKVPNNKKNDLEWIVSKL